MFSPLDLLKVPLATLIVSAPEKCFLNNQPLLELNKKTIKNNHIKVNHKSLSMPYKIQFSFENGRREVQLWRRKYFLEETKLPTDISWTIDKEESNIHFEGFF